MPRGGHGGGYMYTQMYTNLHTYVSIGPAARNRHRAFGGLALRGSAPDFFESVQGAAEFQQEILYGFRHSRVSGLEVSPRKI